MAKKYQFAVRLKEDTASRMVLGYLPSHRNLRLISLAVFGIPFILLSGSVLRNLISGTDTAWGIVAIMLLVFGLPTLSIILNPISHKIVIDEVERELIYYKNYLLGFGLNSRVNEYIYYPGEISITQKTINAFTISIILTMNNSDQVILNFLNRKEEVEQVAARIIGLITAANLTEPETDVDGEVSVRPDFTQITWNRIKSSMEVMRTEIRIWGNSLIFLGLLHLTFYRYLSVSWGTTLLILGLSSIIFQEAPIIIVFVVSLAWAGIYNMLFGGVWIFFGLLFIFSSLRLFWKIRFFQKFEKEYNSFIVQQDSPLETRVQRAPRYFPRLGYLVSSFASAALIGLYIVTALNAISQKFMLGWIFDFINRAGMIGFSVSLAALLSKMRPKWMAWVGIVLGALVMFNELASRLL